MFFYNHKYTFVFSDSFDNLSLKYIVGATLSIICKCGPPLFFMVSGALLLKKEEKFSYILKHRISRIIIVMIICTFLKMSSNNDYNFLLIFSHKLNWYLYQYLAYLFMLPFLRKISLNSNEKEIDLYLILTYIFYTLSGVITFLNYDFSFINALTFFNSNWGSICWYFIFPMSGYFLSKLLSNNKNIKKYIIKFGIISLITLILYVVLCSVDIKTHNGANLENLREHAIYSISCFIFIFVHYVYIEHKTSKKDKIISILSDATFGIFIIETHTKFSTLIYNHLNLLLSSSIGIYWISIISIIIQFIIYALIISLLRIIPIFRKII